MERFIVSTGRCGSTLLSTMLSRHPDVLVVTEFFKALEAPIAHGDEPKSGDFFAKLLTNPNKLIDLTIHRGFVDKEILFALQGKNLEEFSIPLLLIAALPLVTDEPEAIFHESLEVVRTFPVQPMVRHYVMYFDWLKSRLGKKVWLERSGASIELLPEFARMYPDAKYVHIHRDGLEAALSMREHAWFRLFVSFMFDPPTREELERTELAGNPIAPDDPLTQRMTTRRPSFEQFGEFWSQQVEVGVAEFLKMKPGQLLDIRFEDLVARPAETLQTISRFFDFPESPGWIDVAASLVTKIPAPRAPSLSPKDLADLERGCRSGQRLLGRAKPWPGIDDTIDLMNQVLAASGKTSR